MIKWTCLNLLLTFFGLGQPALLARLQPIQAFPQEQQQTQEDWGQWIQGGAKAAPAANLNIDLNLQADGLL
jgi:hypothetical protein